MKDIGVEGWGCGCADGRLGACLKTTDLKPAGRVASARTRKEGNETGFWETEQAIILRTH